MRGPRAAALVVSPMQQALLERLQRRQTADQRLVRRAAILLAPAADPCVQAVARRLGLTRLTVRLWRDRWRQATPALQQAEQDQASPQQLLALIHEGRTVAPRVQRASSTPVINRSLSPY